MQKPRRRNVFSRATLTVDRWLAFAFGVIFVSVLLWLGTNVMNPHPLTVRIYVTVLALAGAGVGAVIPGFLEIRYKNAIRAGGALALGVLIYLFEPAIGQHIPSFAVPDEPPNTVAEKYLAAIDSGDLESAWSLLPTLARRPMDGDYEEFKGLYESAVEPLGKVEARTLVGLGQAENPVGFPIGLYSFLTYKTKFSNDQAPRPEVVVVRANEEDNWEMYGHKVSFTTAN